MRKNVVMVGVTVLVFLVAGSFAVVPWQAAAETKSADEVIAMIDSIVFHADRQEGVNGYLATVTESYQSKMADGTDASPDEQATGKLEVDALEKKRTFELAGGAARELGAFRPSCGPWSLETVMQVESTGQSAFAWQSRTPQ